MTKPFSDQSIPERVATLEAALEKVLDRGPEMSVEPGGEAGTMFVWVIEKPHQETRVAHSLYDIARELEVLLP